MFVHKLNLASTTCIMPCHLVRSCFVIPYKINLQRWFYLQKLQKYINFSTKKVKANKVHRYSFHFS